MKIIEYIPKNLTEEQVIKIIEMYQRGMSSNLLATKFPISKPSILKILHKNEIEIIKRKKLTSSEEKEIIKLYIEEQYTIEKIAQKFNVSNTPIRSVLKENGIKCDHYVPMNYKKNRMKKRIYHFNEDFFEKFNNEYNVYWGGFFLTDGGMNKTNWSIRFKLKKDDYIHLVKFKQSINLEKPLKFTENILSKEENPKTYEQVSIEVHSKKLCEDLLNHFPWMRNQIKTYAVQYPTTVPRNLSRHLIRGILDGDGNIQNYSPSNIKVIFYGTEQLLEKISDEISKNCSVKMVIPKRKAPHLFEIRWAGRKQVLRILSWLYEDAEIYLERKYQQYLGITKEDYMDLITLSDYFSPQELREKRILKGFSRSHLASLMGVSVNYLNNLENGYNLTTQRHNFKKLCEILETDPGKVNKDSGGGKNTVCREKSYIEEK